VRAALLKLFPTLPSDLQTGLLFSMLAAQNGPLNANQTLTCIDALHAGIRECRRLLALQARDAARPIQAALDPIWNYYTTTEDQLAADIEAYLVEDAKYTRLTMPVWLANAHGLHFNHAADLARLPDPAVKLADLKDKIIFIAGTAPA